MGTTKLALRALVEETYPQLLHGMGDSKSKRVCRPITYAACLIPDHMLAAFFISSIDGDSFSKENSSAGASPFPRDRMHMANSTTDKVLFVCLWVLEMHGPESLGFLENPPIPSQCTTEVYCHPARCRIFRHYLPTSYHHIFRSWDGSNSISSRQHWATFRR